MKTEQGHKELFRLMANFAAIYIDPEYRNRKEGKSYEIPSEKFSTVFHGFSEINSALDTLALTEELLRLAPPRSKRIDKDSYLKFLVGSYLQEMYILEQRLTAYAKKLSRLYSKPSLPAVVQRVVYEPLEDIINIRGAHVHQRRFTDARLDSVSTMALFKRLGHRLGDDLEIEYKFAQLDWSKRVKENNRKLHEILNQYCEIIICAICKDGKIYLPD